MVDHREIMRLHSLEFSNSAIAGSIRCSRNTASEVIKLAEEHGLEWSLPDSLTNEDLQQIFYPGKGVHQGRKIPDYEYIFNELAKPEVTMTLLRSEYCAQCEAEGLLPYQRTQYSDKYRAN